MSNDSRERVTVDGGEGLLQNVRHGLDMEVMIACGKYPLKLKRVNKGTQ